MSAQQDIYAASFENRPPRLNKENYVPWLSRLRYAKNRPNRKIIYNSIMNGPYVRRMIHEPGDANRKVPVNETFHEHTYNKLTEKELKQEIWLGVQQMMKGSDIGIQDKNAKFLNEWERFTSTDGESIESYYYRFSKLMNDFKRNKHFLEKLPIANQNLNGNGNVVVVQTEGNAIGNNDSAVIAQKEEAGIQLQAEEFDLMVGAADLDEIEEVNANCILMANLQQASTSGTKTDKTPVYDSDGSAKVHNYDNCYDNEKFNMFTQEDQYTEQLEPIPEPHQVQQNDSNVIFDVSSVERDEGTVDQHLVTVEETHAYFESL
nr:hypothetical protein [Tanacetum cinerariifolium]